MSVESLEKLLVHDLKDLYSAEKQLLEALPKMAKAATHETLKDAFKTHEKQTREHVRRIETIFESLQGSPSGKRCKGMEGLIEEGKEIIEEDMPDDLRDAGLIGAAQKVEHYEIAAYGTARETAELLGLDEAGELLQQTLDEEGETDELLTQIAERLGPALAMYGEAEDDLEIDGEAVEGSNGSAKDRSQRSQRSSRTQSPVAASRPQASKEPGRKGGAVKYRNRRRGEASQSAKGDGGARGR